MKHPKYNYVQYMTRYTQQSLRTDAAVVLIQAIFRIRIINLPSSSLFD